MSTEKVDAPPPYPDYGPPPAGYYPPQGTGPQGPPPPQGYPPVQQQAAYGGAAVTITRPVVVVNQACASQYPVNAYCTPCSASVLTVVEYEAGLLCWLLIGLLCIFGCWLGCCLIPLCVDPCKNAVHRCPNCQSIVGIHKIL